MTSVCPHVCVRARDRVFWMCCMLRVMCVYPSVGVRVHMWRHAASSRIRGPGGERGQRGIAGGRRHPRDQCDGRERRAHAQRRLRATTPRRPHPAWRRRTGRRLWGQHGPPLPWLQHARSGGQEAEVCKADGGEWGFWVSLHREEPVLRSRPSFPLPHSWGNLGNHVWGRGLNNCMLASPLHLEPSSTTSFFFFCLKSLFPLICLSSVIHSLIHSLYLGLWSFPPEISFLIHFVNL